jgi:hypothetical protein
VVTSTRPSGGKDRWATGAWGVLESDQSAFEEPGAPQRHGVATTAEFGGDHAIGRVIVSGQAEDDSGAEGESLRCGRRPGESFELVTQFGGQTDDRRAGVGMVASLPKSMRCEDRTSMD